MVNLFKDLIIMYQYNPRKFHKDINASPALLIVTTQG